MLQALPNQEIKDLQNFLQDLEIVDEEVNEGEKN
jgi:hypothetical protein